MAAFKNNWSRLLHFYNTYEYGQNALIQVYIPRFLSLNSQTQVCLHVGSAGVNYSQREGSDLPYNRRHQHHIEQAPICNIL